MHKIVPGDMEKYIVKLLRNNPLYPKVMVKNKKKLRNDPLYPKIMIQNKQTNKKNRLKLEEKHT